MTPAFHPTLVAVDLGAESCRVSLLRWLNGHPEIFLVHRFSNRPMEDDGILRWDLAHICQGIEEGLRASAELAPTGIAAIGIDGWAVDYVRLDAMGYPIANPFCYRDQRTVAAQESVLARISKERLYVLTGVQILPLNTLFQLHADGSDRIGQSAHWINLPEFVLHRLGGKRVAEYTNASHTQMLGIRSKDWCNEILAAGNLVRDAAPPVVQPGTDLGRMGGPLARLSAFRETHLIAPA